MNDFEKIFWDYQLKIKMKYLYYSYWMGLSDVGFVYKEGPPLHPIIEHCIYFNTFTMTKIKI